MALTLHHIPLTNVAADFSLRLDPHHYELYRHVQNIIGGLRATLPLREPLLQNLRNGINLPQQAYDSAETSEGLLLYASVAAFSQFTFRVDHCQPLRSPLLFPYKVDVEAEACSDDELIITRSGTPGIAWPAILTPHPDLTIVPSGFVMRANVDTTIASPVYVAAILNHPVWRIWSASLAGGKRQRNLSQDHLATIEIPLVPRKTQEETAKLYQAALGNIDAILSSAISIRALCDDALRTAAGLDALPIRRASSTFDTISLADCTISPGLRLDARSHRGDIGASLSSLTTHSTVELRSLLTDDLIKGAQPTFLDEDDGDGAAVIATAAIQAGQVADEQLKRTPEHAVATAGNRQVCKGDVLITLDGEGSIGKAAVYRRDDSAITDSHVGVLRVRDPDHADAVACFINSSLGQAQIDMSISGSTGQTQLAKHAVHELRVPTCVLEHSRQVGNLYLAGLKEYVPTTREVRRLLCDCEASISTILLDHSAMTQKTSKALHRLTSSDAAVSLLDRLRPNMF